MALTTAPPTAGTSLAPLPSPSLSPIEPSSSISKTSQTSKPHKVDPEPELPFPSPSVEVISGFPRINAGYITETSDDDSEFNVAAYPYPNSTSKPRSKSNTNRSPSPSSSASPRRSEDPFASQRGGDGTEGNPFRFEARDRREDEGKSEDEDEGPRPERACGKMEGRGNDANGNSISSSSTSRTQRRKESAMTTSSSPSNHTEKSPNRDGKRHSGLVEKGWARMTGRSGKGEKD